jgi:hypothetical protein
MYQREYARKNNMPLVQSTPYFSESSVFIPGGKQESTRQWAE